MITNPEEEVLVSPAFQNKIISLRQQISDKEAEIVKLNKDIVNYRYTTDQLIAQQKELEGFVAEGQVKKAKLQDDLKSLTDNKNRLIEEIKVSEKTLKEHRIEMEERAKLVYEEENSLKVAKEAHGVKASELANKDAELTLKESNLNDKISKLKEIIQ